MAAPKNLLELTIHLGLFPRTILRQQDLPPAVRNFMGLRDGKLYWEDEHGRQTFSPLSCKHTGSETGLRFTETGFVIEKFGVEQVFTYEPRIDTGQSNT